MMYYGIKLVVLVSVHLSIHLIYVGPSLFSFPYLPPTAILSFPDDNFSKYHWYFTKLCVCIGIVEIWFWIAYGQISSIFDSCLPMTHPYFHFWMITLVNINRFFTKLGMCIEFLEICFEITNEEISSIFDRVICLPVL